MFLIPVCEVPKQAGAPENPSTVKQYEDLDPHPAKPIAAGKAVIYALVDPRTDAVRYVGKADNLAKRVTAHLHDLTDTGKGRWIRSLLAGGAKPGVLVLEEVEGVTWQEAERRWIAHFRQRGYDLTNHTDGGEGLCNASAETREKLRRLRIADWADPERRNVLLQINQSPSRRARISAALTGLRKAPEHIAKLPQMQPGRKLSPGHADKLRQHLRVKGYKWPKGMSPTETTRMKISEALRGNQHTRGRVMPDNERLQRSTAQLGRPKSPETREKIRRGALRRWERHRKEVNSGTGIQGDSDAAHAAE